MNDFHFPEPIKRSQSRKNFNFILKRDDYICQYCGTPTTGIDHIIPRNFRNDNSVENMVACCASCNSIAGDKLFKDFNDKKIYILNRRAQKELGIKDPLFWPDLSIDKKQKKFVPRLKPAKERKSDNELIISRLVGANLRRSLKEKDITKWRLAKDCGITYRTIINWQAGKTKPSDELALRAAEYLGLLKKKDSEIIEIKKEVEKLNKRLKALMKGEKRGKDRI